MSVSSVALEVFEGTGKRRKDWTIDTDISGTLSLQDLLKITKKALLEISKQTLYEEQAKGFDLKPRVRVDNKFDISEESVTPLGKIEYFAKADTLEILIEAYDAILDRSPVATGLYKSANWVFLNGTIIAKNKAQLTSWIKKAPNLSSTDKIRFVNLTPYARKLENLGISKVKRSGRGSFTKQKSKTKRIKKGQFGGVTAKVPNGAYQLAYRAVRSKFKSAAQISFSYLSGSEQGLGGALPFKSNFRTTFKGGKNARQVGRPYVYPSIVIRFNNRGINLVQ